MEERLKKQRRAISTSENKPKNMNKPAKKAKLASNKYVVFKGGKWNDKTVKAKKQMPSKKPMTKTPAQKGGQKEDEGKC